ncbi:hypothetical protein [Catenibacterium mitsuokai]|uniref:hypothetical protein n=1 Tax=Catenibacterium mitsuokai TaxID=100886 RepID=UPI00319E15CF
MNDDNFFDYDTYEVFDEGDILEDDEGYEDGCETNDFDRGFPFYIEYKYEVELEKVIKKWGGHRVSAMEMYGDIFKLGEGYIQKENDTSNDLKANPIIYFKNEAEKHGHYRIMFEDSFRDILAEAREYDFAIMNAITYFGRRRDQNHASKMFAMIIDLDGVDGTKLNNFLNGAFKVDAYPIPNYVVLSGSGVHLYYVFEEPIPLYPNIKLQLKNFKYALTMKIWNQYTSNDKKVQKQGIYQPFRIVDGKTKYTYDDVLNNRGRVFRARAYEINEHPFNLDNLGEFIPKENRVDESKLFRESKMTLADAKKNYPEWYEKVIINKDRSVKKWDIQGKVHGNDPLALYNWWIKKIEEGATYGHRYFCIMCLVIYGVKSNLDIEKIKSDADGLIPFLNEINPENPFTERDVNSALDCFDDRYCTFPINDIEAISGIPIPKNKRNGRKQKLHLRLARASRDILCEERGKKDWREGNGRPNKQEIVTKWREEHPEGSKADCVRETGLTKPTVYKWWNQDK